MKRSDNWPSEDQLEILVDRSDRLFIYASTVCAFIAGGYDEEMEERLQHVIDKAPTADIGTDETPHQNLDLLYIDIMNNALASPRRDMKDVIRVIVSTRVPLSSISIAQLLFIPSTNRGRVTGTLSYLKSVFWFSDKTEPVTIFHASFPDFLFDVDRSGEYHLDPLHCHKLIAELCLKLIAVSLTRADVCKLGSRQISTSSLEQSRVKKYIPEALQYASTYWISHVLESSCLDSLSEPLLQFIDRYLLRWIDCMSLLGKLDIAVSSLRKLETAREVGNAVLYMHLQIKSHKSDDTRTSLCDHGCPAVHLAEFHFRSALPVRNIQLCTGLAAACISDS